METENKKRGGVLRWFAVLMAIFIAAGTVFGMTQMGGDSRVYAAEGTWIYVDGANGNDSNDGSSVGGAVKSWEKAKSLLGNKEGGIYVSGTVQATGNINTENSGKQSVKRADGFTGVMFEVPNGETATFYNIDVDGEDKQIDSAVVRPNSNTTVSYLSGAIFHNIGYNPGPQAAPDKNAVGGMVTEIDEPHVTLLVDGATFKDNNGLGIFFAAMDAPNRSNTGQDYVTFVMKSGTVTGNNCYFYHNECTNDTNKAYFYNALVRNNDASGMGQKYTDMGAYDHRTGVIYVCDMGTMGVRSTDGLAAFDNSEYDLMWMDTFTPESRIKFGNYASTGDYQPMYGGKTYELPGYMPGGGSPNYKTTDNYNEGFYWGVKSNPSQADKDKAVAAATSIFENNKNTLIDSNGSVYFGKGHNDVSVETPVIPAEQGNDNEPTPEPETVDIKVTKEWKNADGTGAATTLPSNARFQLYADGKAVDKQVATITKDQGWTVTFKDQPKYQADGTTEIEYTVDEVSYEPVDSFDKGECTGDAATGFTWTNREKPVEEGAEGKADIVLTKKVTNGNIADYTFKFKIEAESATDAEGNAIKDIPLPAETEVANDAEGKIKFDTITYTKPGTYRYKVTEVIPDKKIDKMHYDTNAKFVTVRVTKAAQ